jgi:hypothetical protein
MHKKDCYLLGCIRFLKIERRFFSGKVYEEFSGKFNRTNRFKRTGAGRRSG